jgi:hypothetical protein
LEQKEVSGEVFLEWNKLLAGNASKANGDNPMYLTLEFTSRKMRNGLITGSSWAMELNR